MYAKRQVAFATFSSPPFLSTLQAAVCWLQGAQSAEHSRPLPSHQLTRVTRSSFTQHIPIHSAMLRGHRCRGREYSVLSLCDHCDYVRYVPVGRVREHSLMMLSDYLTLVMIHHSPCLHGHGGGGVLMYYSTGALNTKYYCDSMHYVLCVCVL